MVLLIHDSKKSFVKPFWLKKKVFIYVMYTGITRYIQE